MKASRDDTPGTRDAPPPAYCTIGATLARLAVWTDQQWHDRPAETPPIQAARVPGLGWVVALPVLDLN